MVYSNPEFFFLFLPVLGLYLLVPSFRWRFGLLLVSSVLFYLWSGMHDTLVFACVVVGSWLSTWAANRWPARKRFFLGMGISLMLLHLFFWKYAVWFLGKAQALFPELLGNTPFVLPLPVGISFFTLQGIAYLVDYGRGEARFIRFREYALFKSFFPQLVAGPIVRVPQLLPQLGLLRSPDAEDLAAGIALFTMGFFKKVLLADRCAPFVDAVFVNPSLFDRASLVWAILAYTVQIWADFSGYTDMGRGAARMLGIRLPENFLSPYLSRSPSEFWRRWHISLSQWIRDYVYIPLGGNRGSRWRVMLVGLTTMGISGLWHGANARFVVWGLYHGVLLAGERRLRRSPAVAAIYRRLPAPAATLLSLALTQLLVVAGWVFFRATALRDAARVFEGVYRNGGVRVASGAYEVLGALVLCAGFQVALYRDTETGRYPLVDAVRRRASGVFEGSRVAPVAFGVLAAGTLAVLVVTTVVFRRGNVAPSFIYFQF